MTTLQMVIIALFLLPLLVAAGWDVAAFRIPNMVPLVSVALFPLAVWLAPSPVALGWHVVAAFVVLAMGIGLFALGMLGGGDVKLMAAVSLWLGINSLTMFLVLVSLAGAALTILLLVLRATPLRHASLGHGAPLAVLQPRAGIPYGMAIAFGGAVLMHQLPMIGG